VKDVDDPNDGTYNDYFSDHNDHWDDDGEGESEPSDHVDPSDYGQDEDNSALGFYYMPDGGDDMGEVGDDQEDGNDM